MPITEYRLRELDDALDAGESFFLYVYTPFCGTCRLTEKMLDIVLQLAPGLAIRKCNANFARELAVRWHIESVPCIMCIKRGEPASRIYRMQSVDALYAWLKSNETDPKGESSHEHE